MDAVVEKKLVVVAFAIVAFVAERVPAVVLVAKVLVEVAFVVVAFVAVKFWRVVEPVARMFAEVRVPVRVSLVPREFVKERFVAKRFVEVADVLVLFVAMSDVTVRFDRLAFVPVKLVENRLVVVAEVPVAFRKVKFWRVDDPVARMLVAERVPKVFDPVNALLSDRSVEEAAVMVMFDPPLNDTPLIVRGVWRRDAVPAFPEIEPVIRDEKMLFPEKVLLSARIVVDAPLLHAIEFAESTPAAVN